jgi:hypothetical protein
MFWKKNWGGRVVKKNPKNFSFTENTQLALTQALKWVMSNRLVSSQQSNGSADLNNCAHSRQDNVDILYNPKKDWIVAIRKSFIWHSSELLLGSWIMWSFY